MHQQEKTKIDQIIVWVLTATIVLLPLAFSKSILTVFALPKLMTLKVVMLALAILWGYKLIMQKKVSYYKSAVNKPFVAYVSVLILTTVFSRYPLVSLIGVHGRFLGFLAFACVVTLLWCARQFLSKEDIIRLTIVSLATSVVVTIYSLVLWSGVIDTSEWSMDPTERVFGTLGHGNHLGAYIGFHFALLIGVWPYIRQKWLKGIFVVSLAPMVVVLFATGSRGAVIATLGGFGVMGLLWLLRLCRQNWHMAKRWILRVCGGALAAGIIVIAAWTPIAAQLGKLGIVQRTIESIEFWEAGHIPDRVSWWFSTIEMVKDRPLFGHGLSSYKEIYNQYRRTDYRVPGDEQDTLAPESAHMEFFTIAAEQGLIGLFVYLWLLVAIAVRLVRMVRNSETPMHEMRFALGITGALTIYIIQSTLSFGVLGTLVPFMIFLGVAWAFTGEKEEHVTHRLGMGVAWTVAIVIIIANLWSFIFSIKQVEAEYYAFRNDYTTASMVMPYEYQYFGKLGEQAFTVAAASQDQEKIKEAIEIAVRAYEKGVELGPTQPYLWMNVGVSYYTAVALVEELDPAMREEFIQKALTAYQKAVEYGPNNPVYPYNLGKAQLLLGNAGEAMKNFEQTLIIRDPYEDTYVLLGAAYEALGMTDKALEYAQKQVVLTPDNTDAQEMVERLLAQ